MAVSIEEMIELSDDGLTLIDINNSAIKDGTFTITNLVTEIGQLAFNGCTNLTSITIPNSVTQIGYGAFRGCTSLTSITIPNSVTHIGEMVFSGCTSLNSITIPDSVTQIGDGEFRNCTSLTSINIPDSVTHIGNGAFNGCTSLTSITIPNSVTQIGDLAFWGCTSLTSITIPNSVTQIGNWAFAGCTSLSQIIIDSDDDNEIARVTALLPAELQSKVINKQQYKQAQNIHKASLNRITNDPNTTDASYISHSNINHDVVLLVAAYLENDYADEAKQEMQGLIIPTDDNWDEYTKKVNSIADKHISKARVDHAKEMNAILTKKHEAEEAAHPYLAIAINHPNVTSGVAGLLAALAVVATTSVSDIAPAIAASTAGLIVSTATFFAIPSSLSAHIASQNKADTPTDEEPAAQPVP